ncbi:MAG: hypothetical protein R6V83_13645 [Candidatus Thorarchaeota archaeon]
MPGLIVRKKNEDLKWYPLFDVDGYPTFYPPDDSNAETGKKVGNGFDFKEYLLGYWEPNRLPREGRRLGGCTSLIVLEGDGDLKYYRFKEYTFYHRGTGDKVGRGFSEKWDYYVAEWTGNGTSDLLVRDDDGHLLIYPWNGDDFEDLGRSKKIGDGFYQDKFPELYPGHWTGGSTPDLLVREDNGDLFVYPFDGRTFKGQGKPRKVGRGFDYDDYTHFLIGHWLNNGTPDLIVRKDNDELRLYPYGRVKPDKDYNTFADPPYERVGRGFKGDWIYLVGYWRKPGQTDLIVCDDNHDMRFYPFEKGTFVDLDDDYKHIGRDWKFTHFWECYA